MRKTYHTWLHDMCLLFGMLLCLADTSLAANLSLTPAERAWLAAHPKIVLGISDQFVPDVIVAADGSRSGLVVDYLEQLNRLLGQRFELYIESDWNAITAKAIRGEIDGLASSTPNPTWDRYFVYSDPYYYGYFHLYARADSPPLADLDALRGKRVGHLAGMKKTEHLLREEPDITAVPLADNEALAKALLNQEVDAVIGLTDLEWWRKQNSLLGIKIVGLIEKSSHPVVMSLRKDEPLLQRIVNKAMRAIPAAERDRIEQRWLAGLTGTTASTAVQLSAEERAYLDSLTIKRTLAEGWMPFSFENASGKVVGITEDYWQLVRAKLGLREQTTGPLAFKEILENLQRGETDLHPSAARTPDREVYALFTDSYEQYPIAIATRRDASFIADAAILQDKVVAVGENYSAYHLLKARYPAIEFLQVRNIRAALQAVESGKAFAAVDILPVLQYQIEQFGGDVRLAGVTDIPFKLQIMVRKEHARLLPLLNRAIAAITPEQRLQIHKTWMNRNIVLHERDYTLLWQVISMALVFIALMWYWNRKLAYSRAQLADSQRHYQSLVAAMNEGVVTHDSAGRIVTCNPAAAKMLGIHCDRILGTYSTDPHWRVIREDGSVWPGDSHPSMLTLRTGEAQRDVIMGVYVTEDTLHWLQVNSAPIYRDDNREVRSVVVTFSDITEKRATRQKLAHANSQRAAIFASTNVVIAIFKQRRFIEVNAYLARLFGYQVEELLGQSTRLLHVDDAHYDAFGQRLYACLAENRYCELEYPFRHRDGHTLWMYLSFSMLRSDGPSDEIAMVGINISERRRMEQALRDNQLRYQRLVDDIGMNYVVFSDFADGRTEYLSKGFAHVFGFPPQLGRRWQELVRWEDATLKRVRELHARFESGSLDDAELEMHFTHPDGSRRTLNVTAHAVRDANGILTHSQGIALDITARKRAEAELREAISQRETAERFAHSVIDALSAHLCVLDEQGTVLMVNRAWRDFADANPPIPENYGIGADYLRTCEADERCDNFRAQLGAVLSGKKNAFHDEYPCHSPQEKRWFVVHVTRFEVDGSVRVVMAHENITARKLAEETIRASEARYRSLITAMAEGVVMQNRAGEIIECNEAAERILGLSRAQMMGRTSIDPRWRAVRENGADFPGAEHPLPTVLRTGQAQRNIVHGIRTPEGELRWVLVNAEPLFNSGDASPYAAVATFFDMTERKQVLDALERERGRLRILINTIPDLIWYKDSEGRYLGCNQRFEQFFGAEEKDILDKTDYDFMDRELADAFRHHDRNALDAGHALSNEEEVRFASDGHRELLETTKTPMYDRHGKVIGVLSIGHDITERNRTEQALIQARQAAEAANHAKSAFLANMSHELRTPLNAILGFAQITLQSPELVPNLQSNVQKIQRGGEYLLTLINDILDLSKIEAGRIELFPEPFEVQRFFTDIVDMFQVRAEQKGIAFHYHSDTSFPNSLQADTKRLRQVALNLLSNAVKFTEHGHVILRTAYQDGYLMLCVEDTGPGIAAAQHEEIFQPFAQTGENRYKTQGTGLGLSISRKIVHLMDGNITVDSTLGKGSCFHLKIPLPVVDSCSDATNQAASRRDIIGYRRTDNDATPLRILIVDDIDDNREVLHDTLRPFGFVIEEVNSGEQCLQRVAQFTPHIVLMDMRMPGLDGLETMHRLHRMAGLEDLPVIIVSASVFYEDREAALASGSVAYLNKPVNRRAILQILQQYLPLTWEYAESTAEDSATEDSATFSDEWLEALEKAVYSGSRTRILTLLEQQSAGNTIPAQLQAWVDNYEYDVLLSWIDRTKEGNVNG